MNQDNHGVHFWTASCAATLLWAGLAQAAAPRSSADWTLATTDNATTGRPRGLQGPSIPTLGRIPPGPIV